MRQFREVNYINVYFLSDSDKVKDSKTVLDIHDARATFNKLVAQRKQMDETGRVIMRYSSGDIVQVELVKPVVVKMQEDVSRFNNIFNKL